MFSFDKRLIYLLIVIIILGIFLIFKGTIKNYLLSNYEITKPNSNIDTILNQYKKTYEKIKNIDNIYLGDIKFKDFLQDGEKEDIIFIPKEDKVQELLVEFIIVGTKKTAIINSKIVKEGDIINGFAIIKIEIDRVLVEKNGEQKWLKISK